MVGWEPKVQWWLVVPVVLEVLAKVVLRPLLVLVKLAVGAMQLGPLVKHSIVSMAVCVASANATSEPLAMLGVVVAQLLTGALGVLEVFASNGPWLDLQGTMLCESVLCK